MDSFFGIGAPELVLILLLAGLVMGPHQIRRIARQLGYWSIRFRRIYKTFLTQLNAELDSVDDSGDIRGMVDEARSLGGQVQDLKNEISRGANAIIDDGRSIAGDTLELAQNQLSTPSQKQERELPPVPPPPNPV